MDDLLSAAFIRDGDRPIDARHTALIMPPRARGNAGVALIVGHGLIGAAIPALLRAAGLRTVCVGRRQRELPGYLAIDLASEAGRAVLEATLAELQPRCAVLVHGPSDVTWMDLNEAAAAAVHCGVAEIVARSGVPSVLVSTDNVFPGRRGGYRPDDPLDPANGYGRVKARAEEILLASGTTLVMRVSLVYGWAGPAAGHVRGTMPDCRRRGPPDVRADRSGVHPYPRAGRGGRHRRGLPGRRAGNRRRSPGLPSPAEPL